MTATFAHADTASASRRDPFEVAATRERLESLSRLMDSAIRVPGTNITFGADAMMGVVPVLGNAATTLISAYIIWEARRLGVSRTTMARMIGNVGLDALVSAVPLLGNIGDVFFKANRRNMALLRRHLDAR